MTAQLSKPEYGIDAPGVIRNLLVIGAACLVIGSVCPNTVRLGTVNIDGLRSTFLWPGAWLMGTGLLMLLYALVGKFKHRERMLGLYSWRGDERVLDVGTGRGLLLVGAARRLTTGHAVGLDIWNKEDLSGNDRELTESNLQIEGVSERCTLVSESADRMSFEDGAFDVVVSNLCLHNIYNRAARYQACLEIVRVLRSGGTAIISDYKLTREYATIFRYAGLQVTRHHANWLTTYPPLAILVATKP
jgi:SAM-dependent methyltransferase